MFGGCEKSPRGLEQNMIFRPVNGLEGATGNSEALLLCDIDDIDRARIRRSLSSASLVRISSASETPSATAPPYRKENLNSVTLRAVR